MISLLCSGVGFAQPDPTVRNLVFEGAGIRGIAYSGALLHLKQAGVLENLEKVGGTSAGGITATLVALGYSPDEITAIVSSTRFRRFNDGRWFFLGGLNRMQKKYGWYRGERFRKWMEELIEAKTGHPDLTFAQLQGLGHLGLYLTGTNLNTQKLLVFSSETYPDMRLADAVRITMSIPMYYRAMFMDSTGKVFTRQNDQPGLDVVIDGGVIGNYPLFLFDSITTGPSGERVRIPNPQTLGIRIDPEEQVRADHKGQGLAAVEIDGFDDYITALYRLIMENLNRQEMTPTDWDRTISVSAVGINPRVRRLSRKEVDALVNSGQASTAAYFSHVGVGR